MKMFQCLRQVHVRLSNRVHDSKYTVRIIWSFFFFHIAHSWIYDTLLFTHRASQALKTPTLRCPKYSMHPTAIDLFPLLFTGVQYQNLSNLISLLVHTFSINFFISIVHVAVTINNWPENHGVCSRTCWILAGLFLVDLFIDIVCGGNVINKCKSANHVGVCTHAWPSNDWSWSIPQ